MASGFLSPRPEESFLAAWSATLAEWGKGATLMTPKQAGGTLWVFTAPGTRVEHQDPSVLLIRVQNALRVARRPSYDYPLTDPRHKCIQGVCDDHAGPPAAYGRRADKIMARQLDSAGNMVSGLDLSGIGEEGHGVANLLWKIAGYLRRRNAPPAE